MFVSTNLPRTRLPNHAAHPLPSARPCRNSRGSMAPLWRGPNSTICPGARHDRPPQRHACSSGNASSDMVLSAGRTFASLGQHSFGAKAIRPPPHSTYGENLFDINGAAASSAEVVNTWASESRNYDYSSNRCRGMCGHYTQIIWGDTKEVGCAVARGGGREVWGCNYDPPGNWARKRPE